VLLISLFLFFDCTENPTQSTISDTNPFNAVEREIIQSENSFELKLFRKINESTPDSNVFISPLSIYMALGLAYNGAEGVTREAIASALDITGFSQMDINQAYKRILSLLAEADLSVQFTLANSLWYHKGLPVENDYIDMMKEFFDAKVAQLDFNDAGSGDSINNWIADKTNGTIKKIVQKTLPDDVMLLLLNAIYFKAIWTDVFDTNHTGEYYFKKYDGSFIPWALMTKKDTVKYFETDLFCAADLPYGDNGCFSMTLFVPKNDIPVETLISEMNFSNWKSWISSFKFDLCIIYLPRFTLSYEIGLKKVLTDLGMGNVFLQEADFTGISKESGKDLYVSNAKHKTYIEVNEDGTEATGATVVLLTIGDNTTKYKQVICNRPFVFVSEKIPHR